MIEKTYKVRLQLLDFNLGGNRRLPDDNLIVKCTFFNDACLYGKLLWLKETRGKDIVEACIMFHIDIQLVASNCFKIYDTKYLIGIGELTRKVK